MTALPSRLYGLARFLVRDAFSDRRLLVAVGIAAGALLAYGQLVAWIIGAEVPVYFMP